MCMYIHTFIMHQKTLMLATICRIVCLEKHECWEALSYTHKLTMSYIYTIFIGLAPVESSITRYTDLDTQIYTNSIYNRHQQLNKMQTYRFYKYSYYYYHHYYYFYEKRRAENVCSSKKKSINQSNEWNQSQK